MLMSTVKREVETFNVSETAEFSIKANGKAFKVLIDGLYSDKIRAVVREIWSNAFDSHVEAGKPDVPFDCHLPTVWEPSFSVRDYGVSLTHNGVMKLYTTVFESSKEDTNTQVGKLGLGSKSPFAYSDTFTVTAWLDGEKRTYSAYIGEDYIPRISLMHEEASDEPQGLEISFPVKAADVHDFTIAAQRTALGFDVLPNIIGSDQIKRATREVLAEGTGWKLYSTSEYGLRAHAKQGCVVYPIDPSAVVGLTSDQRSLLNSCLFIEFPIGDLEITASREGLGYDETTCKNIVKRTAEIEQEVLKQIEQRFSACTTWREALLQAAEIRTATDIPEGIRKKVDSLVWRGKKLPREIYIHGRNLRGADVTKISRQNMYRKRSIEKHISRGSFYVDPNDKAIYFHRSDVPVNGALQRIQHHYQENFGGDVLIIRAMPGSMAFKRVLVALGRPDPSEFIDVTQLPKPPKDSSSYYERKPVKVRVYRSTTSDYRDWEQVDVTGGYYVAMERGDLQRPDGRGVGYSNMGVMFQALKDSGVIPDSEKLYAVPKSLARIVKNDGWTNIFDVINATLDERFDEPALRRLDVLKDFFSLPSRHYRNDAHDFECFLIELFKAGLPGSDLPEGPLKAAYEQIIALDTERNSLTVDNGILTLAKLMDRFDTTTVSIVPIRGTVEDDALDARYPLLSNILEHTEFSTIVNQFDWNALVDYVTLIDTRAQA